MLTLTTELFFQKENDCFLRDHLTTASTVLDIGCGNGAYLAAIKLHYPHLSCTGLEMNQRIYQYASLQSTAGLSFIHSDYRDLPNWDITFDVVIARLVIMHLPDLEHFLAWLRRITHGSSTIIILDYDDDASAGLQDARLPLFESLFQASRKNLLDRFAVPLPARLMNAIANDGNSRIEPQSYRLVADNPEIKTIMHRYMETVIRTLQNCRLQQEQKKELDEWLIDETLSYGVSMFGCIVQRNV
ncbi:class I SAM-dependent methyltransferase [Paenibacillus sacheonensis]|uniref:Methyltransferase domain-containing protein n=1 Tax=Paenibacillus sacheonensis TaxID=742054 RepID=A0A7X4YN30_9BACL|nr:class I SAM-dependent methyltransferase [Paenibacillus sacheonensis]MBM7564809.1 ubiquinone/menaquinone biosynthesis C-methylase UbiE [Paenibacillus sacheonensis]NBC69357.1 methyltransferase domain-containing protein [Paenibacillus sacheonensis]